MKSIKKKTWILNKYRSFLSVSFICFVVLFMIWLVQLRQYEKELSIQCDYVYQMLGGYIEGVEGEQIAADILKDNQNEILIEEGKHILKSYGYHADYKSVFSKRLHSYALRSSFCYLVLYNVLILCIICAYSQFQKIRKSEFEEIHDILESFYNGEYEASIENNGEYVRDSLNTLLEKIGQKLKLDSIRLEKEKEETKILVTDLSHQLKTPVASLNMCFQLLKDEHLEAEERREFVIRLGEQIQHLEGLIAALVNISRMETGMITILKEPVNIFDTLVQSVNSIYIKAEEKDIAIEVNQEGLESLIISHDRKWTKEAIANVLENAVKYSPSGSLVTIRMMRQTQFLRIEIKDEGIGITKQEVNQIFKRFYRGGHDVVKRAEGSGVGLYLTRKILEEQGGNITVVFPIKSNAVTGSTFAIMLPLV